MRFTGRIAKIYPVQTGVSKSSGNPWVRKDFVFEFYENQHDRFSDQVLFSLLNDDVERYEIKENDEVEIIFYPRVREAGSFRNNEMRLSSLQVVNAKVEEAEREEAVAMIPAWKAEMQKSDSATAITSTAPSPTAETAQAEKGEGDDLPF